jgi:hypothetical protein
MVSSSRVSTEQKDQELDTDQEFAKRLGAERAAKDHTPPTMFKLVRAIALLVSDTIYPCFFLLAYGVCWFQAVVALLNLLDGRSRSRSDALLSRYVPAPGERT